MNYIEIINHFWQTHRTKIFTPNETFLYLFLVQECNIRGWVNPFECSNGLICGTINMSEKTLIDVRNRLQQKGMISFEAGQRKKKSPVYKILYCKNVSKNVSTSVSNRVGNDVSKTVNHILKLKETETKEIEIEKKQELIFPFTSDLFFEKWNLLTATPKWKNKIPQSLQLALNGLKKYKEDFVIEMIDQAIVGEWSVFKDVELMDQYKKWQKQNKITVESKNDVKTRFTPPTLEQVQAYCSERKNKVDPQKFIDHYTSVGWIVGNGNKKMKDWQASVRTWEKNNFDSGKSLVNIQEIEKVKEKLEKNAVDIESCKKLRQEIQEEEYEKVKKENPNIGSEELITIWDKVWKDKFVAKCVSMGISKKIYQEAVTKNL